MIKYDPFLYSYTPPGNVTYTSGKARNERFESSVDLVISMFIAEMKEAGMYAIMAVWAEAGHTEKESIDMCEICKSVHIFGCREISNICSSHIIRRTIND